MPTHLRRSSVKISASLLAADLGNLREDIHKAEQAGVDSYHLDIMDGHYVRNYAFSWAHLDLVREISARPVQLHLEISNPELMMFPDRDLTGITVIVQIDTCVDTDNILRQISARGGQCGLGLNPRHSLTMAQDWLPSIDMLLLLAVEPGFGGQKFQGQTLEKIARACRLLEQANPTAELAVDGGIRASNAQQVFQQGADHLIIGTGLFGGGEISENVHRIRQNCVPGSVLPGTPEALHR